MFYSLTYLGFAVPLLNTLALHHLSPEGLMLIGIAVLVLTVPVVLASGERRKAGDRATARESRGPTG